MGHPRDNTPEALEEFFQSEPDPYKYKENPDHAARAETYVQLIAQHNDGKFVDRLLDVGCSEGYLTHIISDAANFTMGIDVSKTAIKRAEESYGDMPDVDFKTVNFLKANTKKKFDVLVMTGVLPFFSGQWEEAMSRVGKLLRKGGLVLVSFVSTGCVTDPWIEKLQAGGLELVDTRVFTCNALTHKAHVLKRK